MQLILLDWEKACRTGQPEKHWRWLTNSMAWNHQQGAMAQWLGPRSDAVIFNDRGAGCRTPSAAAAAGVPDEDTTCSVVVDVATGNRTAVYGMPIYSINYEGAWVGGWKDSRSAALEGGPCCRVRFVGRGREAWPAGHLRNTHVLALCPSIFP